MKGLARLTLLEPILGRFSMLGRLLPWEITTLEDDHTRSFPLTQNLAPNSEPPTAYYVGLLAAPSMDIVCVGLTVLMPQTALKSYLN